MFLGMELMVVEPGERVAAQGGEQRAVWPGRPITNGRRAYMVQADFDALQARVRGDAEPRGTLVVEAASWRGGGEDLSLESQMIVAAEATDHGCGQLEAASERAAAAVALAARAFAVLERHGLLRANDVDDLLPPGVQARVAS